MMKLRNEDGFADVCKEIVYECIACLEAFSVDNTWARLIVFFLGDPQSLESGQGTKDGATDPDGVFTLRWSDDLDLDGGRSKSGDFLLHAVSNTSIHGSTPRHDNVGQ